MLLDIAEKVEWTKFELLSLISDKGSNNAKGVRKLLKIDEIAHQNAGNYCSNKTQILF